MIVDGVANFKMLKDPNVKAWLEANVYSRAEWVYTLLLAHGTFIAVLILQVAAIVFVMILTRIPMIKEYAQ
jgi:hypothetical protein